MHGAHFFDVLRKEKDLRNHSMVEHYLQQSTGKLALI